MDMLVQDLRGALRSLRKSKGITLVVLATLATGIATVTTIFSFVNSALFRLPPYPEAERMVAVSEQRPNARTAFSELSLESVRELRGVRSFERLGVYGVRWVPLANPVRTTQISVTVVDTALLPMLGTRPSRGRLPATPEIVRLDPVVMISDRLWHERFGASEAVLGQTITLDGIPHSIVGVAPAGFGFPERSDAWLPLSERAAPTTTAGDETFSAIAMLPRETSIEQARAEVDLIGKRLAASGAAHLQGVSLVVRDGIVDRGNGEIATLALTFLCAAICVLLIACTNVANLMLVRAAERRTEMAVRASLGASRARLVRQSLTESLVLGLIAGTLGLVTVLWALPGLTSVLPLQNLPSWVRLGVDLHVLGFTLGVSFLTVIAFGLPAALAGSRPDPMSALKSGGPSFSGGRRVTRIARRGVVIELALSVTLFIGSVLLWQTYRNLAAIAPGFDAERVVGTLLAYDEVRHPDIGARTRLLADVHARLLTHPRVEGVASRGTFSGMLAATAPAPRTASSPPTPPEQPDWRMYLPDNPDVAVDAWPAPQIHSSVVPDNFFRLMGIPIARGRGFGAADASGGEPVAIVSEQLARALWHGDEALGKQFRIGKEGTAFTVIGVARDVRFTTSSSRGMDAGPKRSAYYSARQVDGGRPELLVRARGDAEPLASTIVAAIRASDPGLATLGSPETLAARARDDMLGPRVFGGFMGAFALVALLLATIGIYGVLAYGVADRTREIGIRMAVGGTTRDVISLVVRDGMRFVGIGLAIGVVLSLVAAPLLRRFVWGVSVADPRVFALVLTTFSAVALVACWIPARRASRVQPMVALRQD